MIIKREDVGNYFVDEQGEVWECISYCEQPTASLVRVRDKDSDARVRVGGACGCLNFQKFTRLVKEGEDVGN